MRTRPTRLLTAATLAVLATTLIGGAVSAAPKTRWVDDDGRAGPSGCGGSATAKRSIQAAVDAAGPGDTIRVCPGTYEEQVRIRGDRDGLTLRSDTTGAAVIRTPTTIARPRGLGALILVESVDDVTIRGFTTSMRIHAPCDDLEYGILVAASKRSVVRDNRIIANASATADCHLGPGIIVGDSSAQSGGTPRSSSTTILGNTVRDARNGIIVFGFERSVAATISDNTVEAKGVLPFTSSASLRRAAVYGPRGSQGVRAAGGDGEPTFETGIMLQGHASGAVTGNSVLGDTDFLTSGSAFQVGIVVDTRAVTPIALTDPRILVEDNVVRRVGSAFEVYGSEHMVRDNVASSAGVGLETRNLAGSVVRDNRFGAAARGIQVEESAGNRFVDNTVTGAGGFCSDDSTGSRTAGTANTWTGNTATQDSYPAAICPHP